MRSVQQAQKKSIQMILEQQGLANCTLVQMPLDLNVKIKSNPDGNKGERSNSFAQLLGELQFIANATRLNITFAVNHLTTYTTNLSL